MSRTRTPNLVAMADAFLSVTPSLEMVEFLVDRHYDTPPEPDWQPESRIALLIQPAQTFMLIQLAVRSGLSMRSDQLDSLIEIIGHLNDTHPEVGDWVGLAYSLPDGFDRLRRLRYRARQVLPEEQAELDAQRRLEESDSDEDDEYERR